MLGAMVTKGHCMALPSGTYRQWERQYRHVWGELGQHLRKGRPRADLRAANSAARDRCGAVGPVSWVWRSKRWA